MAAAAQVQTVTRLPGAGQRFFNDPVNSAYVLPADSEEGRRLNEQHRNICAAAGGKLVFAPVELQDGDHVLDCATGTGIWTLELAFQSPPGVSFRGVDISPHLFPPPSHTPSNVSFARESILALPSTFRNAFSLVHQRLLISSCRASDWPNILRALYSATKPGGWVQLGEISMKVIYEGRTDMPVTTRLAKMYMLKLFEARGHDVDCVLHVEGWARDAGFVNVGRMATTLPVGAKAGPGEHNYTDGIIGLLTATTVGRDKVHGCSAWRTDFDSGTHCFMRRCVQRGRDLEAVEAMRREWDEVEGANYPFHWMWAQKPKNAE